MAFGMVFCMASAAQVFRLDLLALRAFGRPRPESAGLGRMKVNSNVPPVTYVWGLGCGRATVLVEGNCLLSSK